MAKRKPVIKTTNNTEEDCYVPGCYAQATKQTCVGIPKSNRCASCRKRKNHLGVED